jgi:type IV secretion system protein TrbL
MRKITLCALLFVTISAVAHAQGVTQDSITGVVRSFQNTMQGFEPRLQALAVGTFGILSVIGLFVALARQAFADGDFSGLLAALVRWILVTGLFLWLLTTVTTWGPAIFDSFKAAAATATGVRIMSPGDVFNFGWQVFSQITDAMTISAPIMSVGLFLSAIVIEVVFALMCAAMILTLVQGYFIINCGVLLLAFGALEFTRDIAVAVVRQVFVVGARIFTQLIVVGIGLVLLRAAVAGFTDITYQQIGMLMGEAIVLLVLTWELPMMVDRMLGGAGGGNGGALFATGAAVAGAIGGGASRAVGAATSIAGAGAAAGSATRLASAQVGSSGAQRSAVGRMAAITGQAGHNVLAAAGKDIGRRLSGQSYGPGSAGFRMAEDMNAKDVELRTGRPPPRRP